MTITDQTWIGHIGHVAVGIGYMQGCRICELSGTGANIAVTDSMRYYAAAQRSGRRSVPLNEEVDGDS